MIQASTNLTNWVPVLTNWIPANGAISILGLAATNDSHRFYRAKIGE